MAVNNGRSGAPKVPRSLVAMRRGGARSTPAAERQKQSPAGGMLDRMARRAEAAAKPAAEVKQAGRPVPKPATMGAIMQASAGRRVTAGALRDPRSRRRLLAAIVQAAGKLAEPPLLLRPDLETAIRRAAAGAGQ